MSLKSAKIALSPIVAAIVAAGVVGSAHAVPLVYTATLDLNPGFESTFLLDFGNGFTETALISNTDFVLEVDAEGGSFGSARFLSYHQQIDPLDLPDPMGGPTPISTGDITVEILPGTSGTGSYNSVTGAFSTEETYRVHFTGDLSAYGLTDGFVDLPSISNGQILLGTPTGDRIEQHWEGTYNFPGTPITLGYACHVHTQIVPEPASALLVIGGALAPLLLRRRK